MGVSPNTILGVSPLRPRWGLPQGLKDLDCFTFAELVNFSCLAKDP